MDKEVISKPYLAFNFNVKPHAMKNRILMLGMIFSALLFSSCAPDRMDGASFTENFVQVYVVPNKMQLYNSKSNYISVQFNGREILQHSRRDAAEFATLVARYNDIGYNQRRVPYSNVALVDDISAINVVCDKDFDAAHPAGTSLNDIVQLLGTSCYEYIQDRYVERRVEWPAEFEGWNIREGYYPIFMYLNEIKPGDLLLLNYSCKLRLTKTPPAGSYTLTITALYLGIEITESVVYDVE